MGVPDLTFPPLLRGHVRRRDGSDESDGRESCRPPSLLCSFRFADSRIGFPQSAGLKSRSRMGWVPDPSRLRT